MMNDDLYSLFVKKAATDGQYAIAYAIADLAYQVKYLGNGNAATQMGALEAFSVVFREQMEALCDALRSDHTVDLLLEAGKIQNGLGEVASALQGVADAIVEVGSRAARAK